MAHVEAQKNVLSGVPGFGGIVGGAGVSAGQLDQHLANAGAIRAEHVVAAVHGGIGQR